MESIFNKLGDLQSILDGTGNWLEDGHSSADRLVGVTGSTIGVAAKIEGGASAKPIPFTDGLLGEVEKRLDEILDSARHRYDTSRHLARRIGGIAPEAQPAPPAATASELGARAFK
jgi:hypothetical protein